MTKPRRDIASIPVDLQRNWGWLLGLGVLFVVLGFIGLGMTVGLTLVSILFMGALFIIAGLVQIVDVFKSHHWKGVVGHALIAVLYIIGGGCDHRIDSLDFNYHWYYKTHFGNSP